MADPGQAGQQSRQEAVQPSLWDRLVDDMPGLAAEIDALTRLLAKQLGGAEVVESLVQGGPRAIAARGDLDDDTRQRAHRLVQAVQQQRRLEAGGVIVTPSVLREAVRRDIEMLFNIERLEASILLTDHEALGQTSPAEMLAPFPEVRRSVLNYGVPSFAGRAGADFDTDALSRELRDVLAVYEPRLKRDTIRVKVHVGKKTGMKIDIEGTLMLSPVPERLRLSTTIDLDNGHAATVLEDR